MRQFIDLLESSQKLNPALLTFREYLKVVDEDGKRHPDSAYSTSLEKLNTYLSDKSEYTKMLQRVRIHNLDFEVWVKERHWTFKGQAGTDYTIGVFNDKGQRVGAVQDEWGCVLIMVADEYRGFGLGPMLGKLARKLEPEKPSGGFTPSGYNNFVKVYREIVRDALKSGFYTQQVRAGHMTLDRVKEIVASAHLEERQKIENKNLSTSQPSDWLLYCDEDDFGAFTLYDKKLKDHLDDSNDHWRDQMVLGSVLARHLDNPSVQNLALIVRFGAQNEKFKRFMMTCVLSWCKKEKVTLMVDPEDVQYVDPKYGEVGKANRKTGYERFPVKPIAAIDLKAFATLERRFRRRFDKYDEFKYQMMELGDALSAPPPKEKKDRWAA